MRHVPMIILATALAMLLTANPAAADMTSFLPQPKDISDWEIIDGPNTAAGEELFNLINGGAELYMKEGFVQMVDVTYGQGEASLNIQIYEMKNSEAAQKIYLAKSSSDGRPLDIGQEARLEDYYINYWTGPYQVTLAGSDSKPETVKQLERFARLIAAKLTAKP